MYSVITYKVTVSLQSTTEELIVCGIQVMNTLEGITASSSRSVIFIPASQAVLLTTMTFSF